MDDEQVYTAEGVEENPCPGGVDPIFLGQSSPKDTFAPTVSKDTKIRTKRTAVELLSTALNTRSRKVLQEFELQQSGGFQIGNFQEGLSGDVRITPNGLTGRNIAGLVTFALDTDGNLALVGELRAGSTVTGQVIVGNNRVIIDVDDNGQPSIIVSDGSNDRILIGYQSNGF